jgi:hypothetical protein
MKIITVLNFTLEIISLLPGYFKNMVMYAIIKAEE